MAWQRNEGGQGWREVYAIFVVHVSKCVRMHSNENEPNYSFHLMEMK